MSTLLQFLFAIPKVWAIYTQIAQWIAKNREAKRVKDKEAAEREMLNGDTQKEREDAADKFLDNL